MNPRNEHEALPARIAELSAARTQWVEPERAEILDRRRLHAAWCNAAIEGNPLSWERATSLGRGEIKPETRHDLETLSCLKAAEFMEEAPDRWNMGLVRHLHALVMSGLGGRPGELRDREVKIVKESGEGAGQTVFHPPHPARVPELLEELLNDERNHDEDPFLAAGRFHYEFQSIHPFADGNGRVGRLLSTALARRGWSSRGFHLEPAIRRSGPGYYLALRAVRADYEEEGERGLLPWLLPFLDMAADALAQPHPPEDRP